MSNDLQSTLTLQLGQAVAALRQTQTELGQTTSQVKKLVKEKETLQTKTTTTMRTMQMEAKETQKHYRDLGQSMGKMGGPAGELASRLGGAMGMAGGFSKVAAAAAIAGLAMRYFSEESRRAEQRATQAVAAASRMHAASRSGSSEYGRMATAGLSHADAAKRVTFLAGPDAVKQAESIASTQGIPLSEAMDLVAQSNAAFPTANARKVIGIAEDASKSGLISRQDAMRKIIDTPRLRHLINRDPRMPGEVRNEIRDRILAQEVNTLSGRGKWGDYGWKDIQERFTSPREGDRAPVVIEAEKVARIRARTEIAGLRAAESGRAVSEAEGDLARAQDPVAFERAMTWTQAQRELAEKDEAAKVQGFSDSAWQGIRSGVRKLGFGDGSRVDEAQVLREAVESGMKKALQSDLNVKVRNATGGN